MEVQDRKVQITQSEIELIKCVTTKDYGKWVSAHATEHDNPFVESAVSKYDDLYFNDCKTLSAYRKYLEKFPCGKHRDDAQLKIWDLEDAQKDKEKKEDEIIENIGNITCLVIFLGVLFGPMIAAGWKIGETFAVACSLTPLYYGIYCITRKRKK